MISHGTDTMVETGLFLEKSFPDLKVPMILTGAMTPLGFEGSDGLQNLTESLLAARLLSPGVFVVMHGQVFPIGRVRKDKDKATFVSNIALRQSGRPNRRPILQPTIAPSSADRNNQQSKSSSNLREARPRWPIKKSRSFFRAFLDFFILFSGDFDGIESGAHAGPPAAHPRLVPVPNQAATHGLRCSDAPLNC